MHLLFHRLRWLAALWAVTSVLPAGAAIVQAEYYLGSDPGVGNGTALSLTGITSLGATIQSQTVALALPPGAYEVGIRVKDDAGRWSNPLLKRFTIHPGNYTLAGGLDRNGPASQGAGSAATGGFAPGATAEYFIGNDPGPGAGLPVAVAGIASLSAALSEVQASLAGRGPGTYTAGLRVRDAAGHWSAPILKRFTVLPANYTLAGGLDRDGPASQGTGSAATGGFAPGVTAEYFIGNDPGPGLGQPLGISSAASLSASLAGASLPQAGMLPGTYPVGVRVRNAAGQWSRPVLRSFTQQPSALIIATEAEVAARPPADAPDAAVTQVWKVATPHQCPVTMSQVVIGGVTVLLEARPGETQQAFLLRLHQAINGDPRLAPLVVAQMIGSDAIEVRALQTGALPADWFTASAALTVAVTRPGNLGSVERRISQAEYFVDVDPGAGLGTSAPITFQANDNAAALNNLPVNIQTLRSGSHRIGLRFKNAAGRWGQPLYRGLNSFLLFGSPDVTPPVLTLTGGDTINQPYGQTYTEPGFTAADETDGNLTATVAVSGQVFPLMPGPHLLRYAVVDKAGNRTERTRTVQVVDSHVPVVTGSPLLAYNDPPSFLDIFTGIAASDTESGDLTYRLRLASGSVNWFQSGSYPLVFQVIDAGGNVASFNRTVSLTSRATQYPPFPMWMNGYAAGRSVIPDLLVPSADPDTDGLSNQEEWNADTNPFDPFSNLEFAFVSPTSLWWCGRLRINYRLDSSLNLGTWQPLTGTLNTDTGEDFEVDFSGLPGPANRRFFRLITEPRMPVLVEP